MRPLAHLAFLLLFLAPLPALATGMRRCELHVLDGEGKPLAPEAGHLVRVPGGEITVVLACVDFLSVFPSQSTRAVTPPSLTLTIEDACTAPDASPSFASSRALPLTEAPDHRALLSNQEGIPFAWRGALPAGRHRLTTPGAGLIAQVDGDASLTPRCPPAAVDVARTQDRSEVSVARAAPAELPAKAPSAERWEDRRGVAWELGAGAWIAKPGRSDLAFGGAASFGMHGLVRYTPSADGLPDGEWTRWCVPLALCAGIGTVFMPAGVLLGNELGFDVRAGGGGGEGRVTVRPVMRYAHGAFRTTSVVGWLTPEVGVHAAFDQPATDLVVRWSLMPIDWRMTDSLALGFEPLTVGLLAGLDRRASRGELGGALWLIHAP